MNIAYCTNVRLPSERAHGHQISQVCDALVHLGHKVDILCPFRENSIEGDYQSYYGAEASVQISYIGNYDYIASPLFPGPLGLWAMNKNLRKGIAMQLQTESYDVLYTRTPALLDPLVASGKKVILELHQLPKRNRSQFVQHCNQCALIAALTSPMKQKLIEWGVNKQRIIVEGDAVDVRRFVDPISPQKARELFHVQTDRIVVGYIGRLKTLGMEKGVRTILEGLNALADTKQFFGLIVGGPEEDQKEYEKYAAELGLSADDVCFTGSIPANRIPASLWACDVLAMPWPDLPHYRTHMSPLKMFEYMAANRPIITGDLPTIRDVLNGDTAYFCTPGSTASFTKCLEHIQKNPDEAKQKAATAQTLVIKEYSWEKRMKRVLENI